MLGLIVLVVLNCLSFLLFFFTVPYWTGREMRDVTKNGVYRLVYVGISTAGFRFYQLVELISTFLTKRIKSRWFKTTVHAVVNLLMYVGIIYAAGVLYENICVAITGIEDFSIEFQDKGLIYFAQNAFTYKMMFQAFRDTHETLGLAKAAAFTLVRAGAYIVWTIFYFTFVYGVLKQKMIELHIIKKRGDKSWLGKYMSYESEEVSLDSLRKQCLAGLAEFVDKISIFMNFMLWRVRVLFVLAILMYYSVTSYKGGNVRDTAGTVWGLLVNIADEANLIVTVQSFIVSFLVSKVFVYLGRFIFQFLPELMQKAILASSAKANEAVEAIEKRREDWAAKYDALRREWSEGVKKIILPKD